MKALYEELVPLLKGIVENATNYRLREALIYKALAKASYYGMPCGIRIDPKEPEWPVVFLELPTGQVSWHVEQHAVDWDNHTLEEKYARIDEFIENEK